jgi:NifB/MoaA-like Fe-S oxidoreductase
VTELAKAATEFATIEVNENGPGKLVANESGVVQYETTQSAISGAEAEARKIYNMNEILARISSEVEIFHNTAIPFPEIKLGENTESLYFGKKILPQLAQQKFSFNLFSPKVKKEEINNFVEYVSDILVDAMQSQKTNSLSKIVVNLFPESGVNSYEQVLAFLNSRKESPKPNLS